MSVGLNGICDDDDDDDDVISQQEVSPYACYYLLPYIVLPYHVCFMVHGPRSMVEAEWTNNAGLMLMLMQMQMHGQQGEHASFTDFRWFLMLVLLPLSLHLSLRLMQDVCTSTWILTLAPRPARPRSAEGKPTRLLCDTLLLYLIHTRSKRAMGPWRPACEHGPFTQLHSCIPFMLALCSSTCCDRADPTLLNVHHIMERTLGVIV